MKNIAEAYKILGIPVNSSFDEVKERYHSLVKKFHPDSYAVKHLNINERNKLMSDINEAYDILCKYLKKEKDEDIITTDNKATSRQIKAAEVAFKKGKQFLIAKDINNAINTFETLIRQFPNNNKYMIYYIKSLSQKPRMLHKAKELCMHLLSQNPFEPEILKLTGDIYFKAGFKETAQEYYEKAVEMGLNPASCPNLTIEQKKTKKGLFKLFSKRGS
jgi:curved DNA-binding protein CbpA